MHDDPSAELKEAGHLLMAAPGSGSRVWKLSGVKGITVCMGIGAAKQLSGVGHCFSCQTLKKSPSFVSSSAPSVCVLCILGTKASRRVDVAWRSAMLVFMVRHAVAVGQSRRRCNATRGITVTCLCLLEREI